MRFGKGREESVRVWLGKKGEGFLGVGGGRKKRNGCKELRRRRLWEEEEERQEKKSEVKPIGID